MANFLTEGEQHSLKQGRLAKDDKGNIIDRALYEWLINLSKFYDKWKGRAIKADLYELGHAAGGKLYDLNLRKKIRTHVKVEVTHFVRMNSQYFNCGKYYEFDEKETIKWLSSLQKDIKVRGDKAKAEATAKDTVVKAFEVISGGGAKARSVEVIYGVKDDGQLYTDISPDEIHNYIFTGTRAECLNYIADLQDKGTEEEKGEEESSEPIWVVSITPKNKMQKGEFKGDASEFNPSDYLFTGSEAECDAYIAENVKK